MSLVTKAIVRVSSLLRRVRGIGESITARGGFSVARLVPLVRRKPRRPGLARGRLTEVFVEPLPADELEAWRQ